MSSSTDRRLIDISQTVTERTVVWPGDTPFAQRWVMTLEDGCSCNVATITMSVHCGTHADAPFHFLENGAKPANVPLDRFIGPCRVIPVADEEAVRPADLEEIDLNEVKRVIFKTKRPCTETSWRDDFTYVEVDAARVLAEAGVHLIGIDTPSLDPMNSKTLDAHKTLAAAGVVWLENLNLAEVAPGDYELIALPLKLGETDSAPARAVLRTLT